MVLVLLLLNGGFFAWQYHSAQGKTGAQHAVDTRGEHDPLTLISELSSEQRKTLGVTPKDGESTTPGQEPPMATEKTPEATATSKMAEQLAEKPADTAAQAGTEMAKPATKPQAQDTPIASKPKQQTPAGRPHCYALGPMGNQKSVKQVKLRISSMGLTTEQLRNEVEKVPTNWIYLGPIKTEAEAKHTLQRLHDKGMKDTQLINKGANNFVISVGLFSTKQGADERLKRLQDAGFTPSISQVTAKKSHYWLEVSYNGGKAVDEKILRDMVRGIRGADVKETECKPR